jgi:hypothetical protein
MGSLKHKKLKMLGTYYKIGISKKLQARYQELHEQDILSRARIKPLTPRIIEEHKLLSLTPKFRFKKFIDLSREQKLESIKALIRLYEIKTIAGSEPIPNKHNHFTIDKMIMFIKMFLMRKHLMNNLNVISPSDNNYINKARILKLLTNYLNRRFGKELALKDIRSRRMREKIEPQNIINKLGINKSLSFKKDSREKYIDKLEKCLNRLSKFQDRGAHEYTDSIIHRARMRRIISLTIKKDRRNNK